MKKILLIGLENINNAGDEILRVTTEFLIHQCGDFETQNAQLMPDLKTLPLHLRLICWIWRPFMVLIFRLGLYKKHYFYNLNYIVNYYPYFNSIIKKIDKVVLPIGMLKFSNQEFSYLFDLITKIATKRNIPVLMSAMSIAEPNPNDARYNQLVKAINRPCVKAITTRDGIDGLQMLNKYYVKNPNIKTDYVGDPALWIPQTYNIAYSEKSDVIGINLIRDGIYKDYGVSNVSSDELLQMYKDLIQEVERRGYKWELFCNGMQEDYIVGLKLLKEMNLPSRKLRAAPQNGKELSMIISGYKAIFGARLHACITSVSLGVPVSGLLWDKKLHYFSKTMGIRQFFSEAGELKADLIVNKIEDAMKFKFDRQNRESYKMKTLSVISDFLNS